MPPLPPPPAPPPRRASVPVAIGSFAVVIAVFAAIFLVARQAADRRAEPPPVPDRGTTAADRPISATAAVAAGRLSGFAPLSADLLSPPLDAAGRFEERLTPPPPYDAIDSTLLDAADGRLRLVEAVAVGRNQVCRRFDGTRFACGLEARALLQNGLRGRTLVCDRLYVTVDRRSEVVPARCRADGRDLALTMIAAGYAFAPPLAGPVHLRAEAEARAAKRGVWAGPIERPDLDPAIADDAATPVGATRIGGDVQVPPPAEGSAQP